MFQVELQGEVLNGQEKRSKLSSSLSEELSMNKHIAEDSGDIPLPANTLPKTNLITTFFGKGPRNLTTWMVRRFATRIGAIRANRFAEKPLFS